MNSLKDEIKNAWTYKNAVVQLIIINIAVWLFVITLLIISTIAQTDFLFTYFTKYITLPKEFSDFIYQPWSILSYAFMHSLDDIFHILFNMLFLYWFGRLIQEYLGFKRVISLYVLGALAAGGTFLLAFNLIPYYQQSHTTGLIGASGAVFAIVTGAATLLPDYHFRLLLLGPVKIVYIAAFYIIMSYVSIIGENAGGNIAHLGGALMGYIFIKQLQKGNDWGVWIIKTIDGIKAVFKPKPKVKVSYRKKEKTHSKSSSFNASSGTKPSSNNPSQEEIDAILDKIAQSGYESLSKAEKEKLFNASK